MNLIEFGALGEFIGGIAVIASLVYLAMQVRQSNSANHATARQTLVDTYFSHMWDLAKNPEVRRILGAGMVSFEDLSDDEKSAFFFTMYPFLGNLENGLMMHRDQQLDKPTLDFIGLNMVASIMTPGGQQWWSTVDNATPEMKQYVEDHLGLDGLKPIHETLPYWTKPLQK
jgi:hypothetical protein